MATPEDVASMRALAAAAPALLAAGHFAFTFRLRVPPAVHPDHGHHAGAVHSPWTYFGGFAWCLMAFAADADADAGTDGGADGGEPGDHLALYLVCGGPTPSDADEEGGGVDDAAAQVAHLALAAAPEAAGAAGGDAPDPPPASAPAVEDPPPAPAPWRQPRRTLFWLSLVPPAAAAAVAAAAAPAPAPAPAPASASSASSAPPPPAPLTKSSAHVFRAGDADRGFNNFVRTADIPAGLRDPADGSLLVLARLELQDTGSDDSGESDSASDARSAVSESDLSACCADCGAVCGAVGLRDGLRFLPGVGAAAAAVRMLWSLPALRAAVFALPLPGGSGGGSRASYELQRAFCRLQREAAAGAAPVDAAALVRTFGWEEGHAFVPHDVRELVTALRDHVEERTWALPAGQPRFVSQLFLGRSVARRRSADPEAAPEAPAETGFYDISLDVDGARGVDDALGKLCRVPAPPGGDVQPSSADGGEPPGDAEACVRFVALPPVLQLHLARYEFDAARGGVAKILTRFEYPVELDLSPHVERPGGGDVYLLQAVAVHNGRTADGQYCVYARSSADADAWNRFQGDAVVPVAEERAVEGNFGGAAAAGEPPSTSTAYLLQYVRKDQVDDLLRPLGESDIPVDLSSRLLADDAAEDEY